MIKILHITPHLGGGVGKAISSLVLNDRKNIHQVVSLEKPKEKKFYNKIRKNVFFSKSLAFIKKKIISNDIVQIEYWPHPLLLKILFKAKKFSSRFIFWCHFVGTKFPKIHKKILFNKAQIIFTTMESYKIKHSTKFKHKMISSATVNGFTKANLKKKNNFLYVGSYHSSKIHPKFLDIIKKNKTIIKKINFYGENELQENFFKNVKKKGLTKYIKVHGFRNDIGKIFNNYKFLLYFLNPRHYGSAENILIESMSLGVIPIVLDNKVEKNIITNNKNGFVIKNLKNLDTKLESILKNKKKQKKISKECIRYANNKYSIKNLISNFNVIYKKLIKNKKYELNFANLFESNEYNFFKKISEKEDEKNILSENKCGLKHYLKIFPKNSNLNELYKKIRSNVQSN